MPRKKNDKYYCVICSSYVRPDTRCVCCSLCDYRFHLSCISMQPDDIVLLENWFCSVCACVFPFYATSDYDVINWSSSLKDKFSKIFFCDARVTCFSLVDSVRFVWSQTIIMSVILSNYLNIILWMSSMFACEILS
jgi:hypothetical protein